MTLRCWDEQTSKDLLSELIIIIIRTPNDLGYEHWVQLHAFLFLAVPTNLANVGKSLPTKSGPPTSTFGGWLGA